MEVGDSFAVTLSGKSTYKGEDTAAHKLRSAAKTHGRRYDKKFTVRTYRDEGIARCWRIG
jgi:hypothetical protein